MDYIVKFQVSIYALILLAIMFFTIEYKSKVKDLRTKIFKFSILATSLAIIIEPLTWYFDGKDFFGAYFLEYSTNFLLLFVAPVLGGLMLSYVDYYINRSSNRIKKLKYYMYPLIFTLIMLIVNLFYPIYFDINRDTNIYSPGDFLWVHNLIVVIYYLYMLIYSLLNRHKITKFALMIFMILFALPIIGMVLQMFINELFFTWTSIALALLVIYIFLESTTGDIDYLTKLYSRNSYEKYVKHLIESEREFCVVFIDLDNFKYINDKFGHLEGDRALCEFSKILEKLSSPNKMVCRLAGDEFIVVLEVYDNIDEILERVQATMILSKEKTLNRLQFSYGYQCYKKGMTLDQLYVMVDEKMYKSKQSKEKTGY